MNPTIRSAFPVVRSGVYLNTAAIGPMPTATIEAVASQLNDVAANGSANIGEWLATKERVRTLVASMLGGSASDIAFTRNTTDGLCAVAAGLDWKPGDNIVTFADEFPANYYPWRSIRDKFGVEIRSCRQVEGRVDVDELCSMIDARTRLVAVSAVQYCSGFRVDVDRIGAMVRRHDSLFVLDIIQAFGAFSFDLPAQNVDIAVGAAYKWLCGPEGCGIFYANDRARERIAPISHGWTGVARPWDFGDRDQAAVVDTRVWETGMGGTALLCGLEASLDLLSRCDLDAIATYLEELTDFLCEIVPTDRYEVVSSRRRSEKSQIVCLKPLNGSSAGDIAERLRHQRIIVSSRAGSVRVSPHLFNTYDDLEALVDTLT